MKPTYSQVQRLWTVGGQIRLERPDYGRQLDSDALSVEQMRRPSPFPQQDPTAGLWYLIALRRGERRRDRD